MKPIPKSELDNPAANRTLLVLALRRLPEGFEWDYSNPCRCAMGLAQYLGLIADTRADEMATAIGAERDDVHAICFYAARPDQEAADVTPEQIARRIERLP